MTENFVGRVYKLVSPQTDKVYIGSTKQTLKRRLQGHKHDYARHHNGTYNYTTSFGILKYADVSIQLLYEGEFACAKEMHIQEGQYIQVTVGCINNRIEGRSIKQWYKDNKHDINDKEKNITSKIKMLLRKGIKLIASKIKML